MVTCHISTIVPKIISELIPGGADIDVTDNNKEEYISKLVQWHLTDGIKPQINGLVYGFEEVFTT